MKKVLYLIFCLVLPSLLFAQNYEDFYLKFWVLSDIEKSASNFKVTVRSNANNVVLDEDHVGSVMYLYTKNATRELNEVGTVTYTGMEEGSLIFEVQVPVNQSNEELISQRNGLLKVRAASNSKAKNTLVYEMYRLNIGMYDVYGTKNLLSGTTTYDKEKLSADEHFIPELLKEVIFVAGEMRTQMESPTVKTGRFIGMDMFTAMEKSTYWDVYSFLTYVKAKPYKYQGVNWKFSEIYATWIDGGTPGLIEMETREIYESVKEKMLNEWAFDAKRDFEMNFLLGIDQEILKGISSEFKREVDMALTNENIADAYKYYYAAEKIARFMDDPEEIAWCHHKHGQICVVDERFEQGIEAYIDALQIFKEVKNEAAQIIVYNDLGSAYNTSAKDSKDFTAGIKSLQKALNLTKEFPKDHKVFSSVTALIYSNLGDSYAGLEKFDKALNNYNTGLEYTNVKGTTALKRKARLEMKISIVYETLGNETKQKQFEEKAVYTYREYEAELAKVKKL